jgi:predicted RNA-binding Zn-ribbon protein involved in translation (DUF1610 family)
VFTHPALNLRLYDCPHLLPAERTIVTGRSSPEASSPSGSASLKTNFLSDSAGTTNATRRTVESGKNSVAGELDLSTSKSTEVAADGDVMIVKQLPPAAVVLPAGADENIWLAAGQVVGTTMTVSSGATEFNCPQCGALYKLIRVEAPPSSDERGIMCRNCGAPLQGREGRYILKYFMVNRPKQVAAPRRRR